MTTSFANPSDDEIRALLARRLTTVYIGEDEVWLLAP